MARKFRVVSLQRGSTESKCGVFRDHFDITLEVSREGAPKKRKKRGQ